MEDGYGRARLEVEHRASGQIDYGNESIAIGSKAGFKRSAMSLTWAGSDMVTVVPFVDAAGHTRAVEDLVWRSSDLAEQATQEVTSFSESPGTVRHESPPALEVQIRPLPPPAHAGVSGPTVVHFTGDRDPSSAYGMSRADLSALMASTGVDPQVIEDVLANTLHVSGDENRQ